MDRNKVISELSNDAIRVKQLLDVVVKVDKDTPIQSHHRLIISDKDFKGKVLDVGGGFGIFSMVAKLEHPDIDITILDGSIPSCNIAYTIAYKSGIKLCVMRGLVFDNLKEKFDTIVLNNILEHLPNPSDVLKWVNGLLNPGGTVFITVPFEKCHQDPLHINFFTTRDIPSCTNIIHLLVNIPGEYEVSVFDGELLGLGHSSFKSRGQLELYIKIKKPMV